MFIARVHCSGAVHSPKPTRKPSFFFYVLHSVLCWNVFRLLFHHSLPPTIAINEFQPFNFFFSPVFDRHKETLTSYRSNPIITHEYALLLLGEHAVSRRVYFLSDPENNKRLFRRPRRLPYDCRDYWTGHRNGENCHRITSECIINRYISIRRRGANSVRCRRTSVSDHHDERLGKPTKLPRVVRVRCACAKPPPRSRCDRRRSFSVCRPSARDYAPSANRSFGPIRNRNVRRSKTNIHGMLIV